MKNKRFFMMLPILAAVMLTASQCGGENAPEKVIIPTTNFDYISYGCGMTYANMQSDTVYVINSQEEFAQYFTCETNPQIDFATKTLLIARGIEYGDVGSTTCELLKNNNKYILNVDVIMCFTASAVPTNWDVAIIIDKNNIHNIMLNVNIIR
jgi:hypothetical protein